MNLDDMPPALAARARAATGRPDYLSVHCADGWVVEAVTGDVVTVMHFTDRPNGAVAESTHTFRMSMIVDLRTGSDAVVTVDGLEHIDVAITEEFAEAIRRRRS
jgi:hypothetical protein